MDVVVNGCFVNKVPGELKKGNNSNKMLDRVLFSCQQNGVNTFYKCIEFQVNSFDSY
jgi:hypothetical protein